MTSNYVTEMRRLDDEAEQLVAAVLAPKYYKIRFQLPNYYLNPPTVQ